MFAEVARLTVRRAATGANYALTPGRRTADRTRVATVTRFAERALTGTRRNIGGSIAIGMQADIGGEGFVGTIDEVRLWNRVPSECELRTLAGKPCDEN